MSPVPTKHEFLSARDQDWVARNSDILNATFAHYEAEGEWPEPAEIIRPLRAANPTRKVVAALDEMPNALGHREDFPRRLVLSIFGLGCCERAAPLLGNYLAASQMALRRFDLPSLTNRLSRKDVSAELGLGERELDRLSELLMRDAPFLASGDSNLNGWDREIDLRVEEFQGFKDSNDLLVFLSRQRRIAEEPQPPPAPELLPNASAPSPDPEPAASNTPAGTLTIAAGLAAVGGFVYILVSSPSVWSLTALGLFIGLVLARPLRRFGRQTLLFATVGGALVGAGAGLLLTPAESHDPYRYFVASTGKASVLIGRIGPSLSAPLQRETVLGVGDPVEVRCLLTEEGEAWAKLENGSFLPAARLSVEVGGGDAPIC